ncbi:MAG: hypothetical protein EZS28_040666, partial [Streblomastix strix]
YQKMENKEIKEQKKPRKKYIKKVKPAAGGGRADQVEPVIEPATEPVPQGPSKDQVEPQMNPSVEPKVEAPKQRRPRKYQTEEEAKEKARLQRKQFKQRPREKQKLRVCHGFLLIQLYQTQELIATTFKPWGPFIGVGVDIVYSFPPRKQWVILG